MIFSSPYPKPAAFGGILHPKRAGNIYLAVKDASTRAFEGERRYKKDAPRKPDGGSKRAGSSAMAWGESAN